MESIGVLIIVGAVALLSIGVAVHKIGGDVRVPTTEAHDNDHVSQAVMLIRLRHSDNVGNTRRVAHLVPVREVADGVPETMTAWCGSKIPPAEAELLERFTGMPCEHCLANAPHSGSAQLRKLTRDDHTPQPLD
ncbi:MAG: hypothetical protein M3443_07900 [Actinomycetota bacterium]|nr:hypothetical protein [Actinomycetota bacterium]